MLVQTKNWEFFIDKKFLECFNLYFCLFFHFVLYTFALSFNLLSVPHLYFVIPIVILYLLILSFFFLTQSWVHSKIHKHFLFIQSDNNTFFVPSLPPRPVFHFPSIPQGQLPIGSEGHVKVLLILLDTCVQDFSFSYIRRIYLSSFYVQVVGTQTMSLLYNLYIYKILYLPHLSVISFFLTPWTLMEIRK